MKNYEIAYFTDRNELLKLQKAEDILIIESAGCDTFRVRVGRKTSSV